MNVFMYLNKIEITQLDCLAWITFRRLVKKINKHKKNLVAKNYMQFPKSPNLFHFELKI